MRGFGEVLDFRVNQEKRSREMRNMGIPETLVGAVAASVAEIGLELFKEFGMKKKKEYACALESRLTIDHQLYRRVETLEKDFQKGLDNINHELKYVRAELQNNQGKNEEDIPLIPETLLKKNKQELSEKIKTVKDDVEQSKEDINHKLQKLRDELEEENQGMKKEKERAWALESRLKRKMRQFSRRTETLQEDVEEWPETIMLELQVRGGVLKNMKGMKKEDIASALETLLKKNKQEFSQKIETLKEDVEDCMEAINHDLHILRDDLEEKKQGKNEEDIPLIPETLLKKNKQELSEKIETLKEDVEDCMEAINHELQNIRDELEEENQGMKKEKERAWALESRLKRKMRQFSRRTETLQEDVEEWPETIMLELQVRGGVLKNMKGMKKEDIALALENMLKKGKREFSQKIETLKEDVEDCMEAINHELHILRDDLEEKKQGKMEGE
ncbi:golgin subfamily A member 6-like protein 6 [Catharus ustulatus]|uniref:golgin subfamily A member 6-like protein 6 n=1 Tax=Catharus ustulatus TaxID=91951 RepID=UPI00140E78A4|nr:golgin subfamily A member 6-like protein 6 [Catharus ustulatus]